MHLVIFEGTGWKSLAPLSLSRPTFTLLSGMNSLLDKQLRCLRPTRLTLWVRPELVEYCRRHVVPSIDAQSLTTPVQINHPLDSDPATLLDGSTLFLDFAHAAIDRSANHSVAADDGTSRIRRATVVAPGLSQKDAIESSPKWKNLLDLPRVPLIGKAITHLWDLMAVNEEALLADAAAWTQRRHATPDGPFHLLNKEQILLGENIKLGPGCVIDASKGTVVVADGAIIGANAVVQGPCFIGPRTEITPLSLIRPGTSFGPNCKMGGEIARAIVMGYSNKAHEGFLGDSYLGEWINLGAGTTTSNLKNTYGSIGMNLGGGEIDTGRKFLGSIIGDHTKTAISTRFMSGSYVGYCSMIATSAHAARLTPSFSFCTDKGTQPYRVEKAFEVARAMFSRRNRALTNEDESLMRYAGDAAKIAEHSA